MPSAAPTLPASPLEAPRLKDPAPSAELAADDVLMQRTAAGDRHAFGELVEMHKDNLLSYLTRLCADRDRAEDLAQESFVRLYQAAARYRREGNLKGYLFRIATNLLRSEQRRERRWRWLQPVLKPSLQLLTANETVRPQQQALANEAQRQVAGAVTRLPLRLRVPLVLHEIEGWPYRRIAELLGCREGTIKSRIHRARQRLKNELAPYWQGGSP